ncbi:MAG: hypothetical protein WBE71_01120 [Xanthobacteraceae bacterium]
MLRVALDPKSAPALDEELGGITFNADLDPEFDETAIGGSDAPEYLLDDSVFVALRINLEAIAQETLRIGVARLGEFVIPIPLQIELPIKIPQRGVESGVFEQMLEDFGIGDRKSVVGCGLWDTVHGT